MINKKLCTVLFMVLCTSQLYSAGRKLVKQQFPAGSSLPKMRVVVQPAAPGAGAGSTASMRLPRLPGALGAPQLPITADAQVSPPLARMPDADHVTFKRRYKELANNPDLVASQAGESAGPPECADYSHPRYPELVQLVSERRQAQREQARKNYLNDVRAINRKRARQGRGPLIRVEV